MSFYHRLLKNQAFLTLASKRFHYVFVIVLLLALVIKTRGDSRNL